MVELLLAGKDETDADVIAFVDAFLDGNVCDEDPFLCRRVIDVCHRIADPVARRRAVLSFVWLWGKLERRASTVPWPLGFV